MVTLDEMPPELSESHEELVVKLLTDIRNGKLERSDKIALATLSVLEEIIRDCNNEDPMQCVSVLRAASRRLRACVCACGVARRLLREYRAAHHKECGGAWLRALVAPASGPGAAGSGPPPPASGPQLVAGEAPSSEDYLREMRCELESSVSLMSRHLGECGPRATLVSPRAALAAPHAHARTHVLLPDMHQFAEAATALSAAGARVVVVPMAAALALMPTVHKVVVWGVRVEGGGAARGARGERGLAAAAHRRHVPVLVLCPLQHLCPTHLEPAVGGGGEEEELDVIPADLITLFVTNIGCISPSYMYRLMSELYDPSDYDL